MNDLKMGFKHTILQRLHSYDVCPGKTSPSSSSDQSQSQPQVTDFSINRILGGESNSDKTVKSSNKKYESTSSKFPSLQPSSADILDLSKTSAHHTSHDHSSLHSQAAVAFHHKLSQSSYQQALHSDFLAAAAAANATKFYAQFFPHMFPTAYAANLSSFAAATTTPTVAIPTTPAYQKRYFAPYIVNSRLPPTTTTHLNQISSTDILRLKNSCTRSDCTDCLDYQYPQRQFPYKSASSFPVAGLSPNHSSSKHSINYLKTKSSTASLLNSAASSISLATVTNLNLPTKPNKINCMVNTATVAAAAAAAAALNAEEISYKCRICDKVFGCSQTLQAHEKTHKSPRYECSDCGKGFSQLRNYKYHLSVHRGTKEFAAECPECGKTFNDKGYLSSHMKIHRNKKEYECPYCPKSFNQRVAFNMHVRIHTGVKPHKCVECGKRFSRKMLLKQHMRTHSGEKPYQCSVCGKSFADRSNMTLHHRLHSGIKPFNCPICPKAFTKKHHLKTHLNYHTGCKPYVCPHPNCNQAFTQSSNMRTHAKKCQYRPLSAFPVNISSTAVTPLISTTAAAGTTSNCLVTTSTANIPPTLSFSSSSSLSLSRLPSLPTAAAAVNNTISHIPHHMPNTLSAGIRMLSAASSIAVSAQQHQQQQSSSQQPFPPAQQPLLSTLRPF